VSVSFVPTDGSAELKLLVKGEPEQVDEARAAEILKAEDLAIKVELGLGEESASYYTCDLSHEYISISESRGLGSGGCWFWFRMLTTVFLLCRRRLPVLRRSDLTRRVWGRGSVWNMN